jgi:ring-1,2-phenylacetyl-CoA epoxidase subunit PaaD
MSALTSQPNASDVARAWVLLDALTDPEIPVVSLRELGILRDVRAGDAELEVVITPTYSGCPAMGRGDSARTPPAVTPRAA